MTPRQLYEQFVRDTGGGMRMADFDDLPMSYQQAWVNVSKSLKPEPVAQSDSELRKQLRREIEQRVAGEILLRKIAKEVEEWR